MFVHSWLQRWASHSFTSAGGGPVSWRSPHSPDMRAKDPAPPEPHLKRPFILASRLGPMGIGGSGKGKVPTWGMQLRLGLVVESQPAAWRRQPQTGLRSPRGSERLPYSRAHSTWYR